jgi:hypothetical protein
MWLIGKAGLYDESVGDCTSIGLGGGLPLIARCGVWHRDRPWIMFRTKPVRRVSVEGERGIFWDGASLSSSSSSQSHNPPITTPPPPHTHKKNTHTQTQAHTHIHKT